MSFFFLFFFHNEIMSFLFSFLLHNEICHSRYCINARRGTDQVIGEGVCVGGGGGGMFVGDLPRQRKPNRRNG